MIRIILERGENTITSDIDPVFRTAILGENGIGKTTILHAVADKVSESDWLTVQVPKNLNIAYFSQVERNLSALSGGEHTKRRLEDLFAKKADLYALDEPTNNLDSKNIEWLKAYILKRRIPIIFTSHDIGFIDDIAEIIFYLDSKGVDKTKEKCSSYLITRRKKIERAFAIYEDNLKKQKNLYQAARQASDRSESGSKWKGTDNDKFLRGFNRNAAGKSAAAAKRLRERAEELEVEEPHCDPIPRVVFRKGDTARTLFSIRATTLRNRRIDFSVGASEKILLCGENGTGKTTFVKYIVDLLKKGSSHGDDVFKVGENFKYFYLSQNWYEDIEQLTAIDYLKGFDLNEQDTYRALSYNYLDPGIVRRIFRDISPGVRIKVLLGALSLRVFDLIIWDEPTNHLDVMTQSILHQAFVDYEGALILVSHDKKLLEDNHFTKIQF